MKTPNVQKSNKQEQSSDAPAKTVGTMIEEKLQKTCKTPGGVFSSPIGVDEGNSEIGKFKAIQPILTKLSTQFPALSNEKKFLESIADNNVFVFDRNMIERFKNLTFDYYAVCLGFNEAGATVIFGAFKEVSKNELQSIQPTGDDDCSLSEHPQRRSIINITRNLDGHSPLTILLK